MNLAPIALLAAFAFAAPALAQIDLKGKMKVGEYQYNMSVEMGEMPGMPKGMAGMKMPPIAFKHCVTQKDVDEGNARALGQRGQGGGELPKDCQIKDMKTTGSTVSYRMVCTGEPKMDVDASMTFTGDGFKGVSKMKGMAGGQAFNSTTNMDVRYVGPCKG